VRKGKKEKGKSSDSLAREKKKKSTLRRKKKKRRGGERIEVSLRILAEKRGRKKKKKITKIPKKTVPVSCWIHTGGEKKGGRGRPVWMRGGKGLPAGNLREEKRKGPAQQLKKKRRGRRVEKKKKPKTREKRRFSFR